MNTNSSMSNNNNNLNAAPAHDPAVSPRTFLEPHRIHTLKSVNDDVLLGFYLENNKSASTNIALHQQLSTSNISRAREVLDKAPALQEKRASVESRLKELKDLDESWQSVEHDMFQALAPYTSHSLQARLAHAAHESDAASNALLESFLLQGNAADFISAYRRERKQFYLRKERLDRWQDDRVLY